MSDKPTSAVQEAIDGMKTFSGDDGNRGVMTSTPHNTAGSAQAAIRAALLNTHLATQNGEPEFPQGRTLFFETQLEGVPFVFASAPQFSEIPSTFDPGKTQRIAQFKIWLLDTTVVSGHYDTNGNTVLTDYNDDPQPMDAQISGAYMLSQLDSLGYAGMRTRVWTIKRNPNLTTKRGDNPRMFAKWEPAPDILQQTSTF